ncbi:MAG: hypothetical protein DMG96_25670 [Acidobacteria bacterium]|nr:MAG: hypothetical protein DMG96_25670 [Acidobacteriota bacterium]
MLRRTVGKKLNYLPFLRVVLLACTHAARASADPVRPPLRELQAVLPGGARGVPDLQLQRTYFYGDRVCQSRGGAVGVPQISDLGRICFLADEFTAFVC